MVLVVWGKTSSSDMILKWVLCGIQESGTDNPISRVWKQKPISKSRDADVENGDVNRGEGERRWDGLGGWPWHSPPLYMNQLMEAAVQQSAQRGAVRTCGVGGGGRRRQREGTYVHMQLIHVVVQQKVRQHCKAIILQLKEGYTVQHREYSQYFYFFSNIL